MKLIPLVAVVAVLAVAAALLSLVAIGIPVYADDTPSAPEQPAQAPASPSGGLPQDPQTKAVLQQLLGPNYTEDQARDALQKLMGPGSAPPAPAAPQNPPAVSEPAQAEKQPAEKTPEAQPTATAPTSASAAPASKADEASPTKETSSSWPKETDSWQALDAVRSGKKPQTGSHSTPLLKGFGGTPAKPNAPTLLKGFSTSAPAAQAATANAASRTAQTQRSNGSITIPPPPDIVRRPRPVSKATEPTHFSDSGDMVYDGAKRLK